MLTAVSSCFPALNKHKCRTVKQPWSVLESMYDVSVSKWQFMFHVYNESECLIHIIDNNGILIVLLTRFTEVDLVIILLS